MREEKEEGVPMDSFTLQMPTRAALAWSWSVEPEVELWPLSREAGIQ